MRLEGELKLVKHVETVCCSSYYQIRQLNHIRHIRRYLDFDLASKLVHSFITSRIDYCNGLLAYASTYQIDQLQGMLNVAARHVLHVPRFDRDRIKITYKLHWLCVPERVTYKLYSHVYKLLHGLAPGYLAELCIPVAYRQNLRSADKNELQVPRHKLSIYGPRSFIIAGRSHNI